MTLITGNTYPHRQQLRAMGGEWDASVKGWRVPEDAGDRARALVASGRAYRGAAGLRVPRGVSHYTRFSSGAEVYVNRNGRCEDAPCCGCCS
jgi:hypothetical protein